MRPRAKPKSGAGSPASYVGRRMRLRLKGARLSLAPIEVRCGTNRSNAAACAITHASSRKRIARTDAHQGENRVRQADKRGR